MILLGDSDISRWPASLYPRYPTSILTSTSTSQCNYAVGGAQMSDVLQQINKWKEDTKDETNITVDDNICICCAGENDLGSRSIDQILETFRAVLDAIFPSTKSYLKMIFIGPKFEPWLINDNTSRKQYTKLNNGLQRATRKHHATSDQITYIDCLTLFCTEESANVPGAIHSKAIPDNRYFDKDGLHLNDMGYEKWKEIIEQKLMEI